MDETTWPHHLEKSSNLEEWLDNSLCLSPAATVFIHGHVWAMAYIYHVFSAKDQPLLPQQKEDTGLQLF